MSFQFLPMTSFLHYFGHCECCQQMETCLNTFMQRFHLVLHFQPLRNFVSCVKYLIVFCFLRNSAGRYARPVRPSRMGFLHCSSENWEELNEEGRIPPLSRKQRFVA